MPIYSYKARDAKGQAITGHFEAASAELLDQYFHQNQWIPIATQECSKPASVRWKLQRKLPELELIAFTRQLGTAYAAGISIVNALELLAQTVEHTAFRDALLKIVEHIQEGQGLAQSFAAYPGFFSPAYLALLQSGEISGNLEAVLFYQADLMEKRLSHRERVQSALLYPKLVIGMMVLTVSIVTVFVVPQFAQMYEKFQAKLPLPTRILIESSSLVRSYWWAIALTLFVFWLAWKRVTKLPHVRIAIHRQVLRLPLLGPLFMKIDLAQFCTVFAILIRAGIRITEAIRMALESLHNQYLRSELLKVVPLLEEGGSIGQTLKKVTLLPALFTAMMLVGEETGRIDPLLERLAQAYERETDAFLKRLPTLLEPILLGSLFVLVLFLALAIYLPLWKMAGFARAGMGK